MTSSQLVFMAQILCLGPALGLPLVCAKALSNLGFTSLAKKALLGISMWISGVSILAISGLFKDFSGLPPRPFFVLFPAMITVVYWSFRPHTGTLLQHISPPFSDRYPGVSGSYRDLSLAALPCRRNPHTNDL